MLICFNFTEICSVTICSNRIGTVMDSVFASSAVNRGFEPRSDKTKDYEIGICCFSAKFAALSRKSIGAVMDSVLASSAVNRGFEPRSSQTKD